MDRTEIHGSWVGIDEDKLWRWCKYFYETEVHDRQVCKTVSIVTGNAMPVAHYEVITCGRFARQLFKRLGLNMKDEEKAIAAEYSMEYLKYVVDQRHDDLG